MKRASNLLLVISVLIFITVLYFKFSNKVQFTQVFIAENIKDIGKRNPNEKIDLIFEIENIGDHDFLINKIDADCHCTVPSWTKEATKKGEIAKISVSYNNNNLGYFQQSIKVHCNVKDTPIILTIQGRTVGE